LLSLSGLFFATIFYSTINSDFTAQLKKDTVKYSSGSNKKDSKYLSAYDFENCQSHISEISEESESEFIILKKYFSFNCTEKLRNIVINKYYNFNSSPFIEVFIPPPNTVI
jgi:hypothetical protein